MPKHDVVRSLAFLHCSVYSHRDRTTFNSNQFERPCAICLAAIQSRITSSTYIDEDLIETTAIAIVNIYGDYIVNSLTPTDYDFALRLLEDIIPLFLEKVREAEVKQRITDIKSKTQSSVELNGM